MSSDDRSETQRQFIDQSLRHASRVLFLIESQSAHLTSTGAVTEPPDHSEEERDEAYLTAFSTAGRVAPRPSIAEIERYAPNWSHLVPDDVRSRAALAYMFGKKYALARERMPNFVDALGLETEQVRDAFADLFGEPLETIFRGSA